MVSHRNELFIEPATVKTLNRVVDFGLACVLFVAPLALAGRFAVGRLLLVSIIGITATAWGFSRFLSSKPKGWLATGAEWLALLAVLLVLVQVIPLPTGIVQSLSPSISELLPLHHGVEGAAEGASLTGWSQVSLAPHETRSGLAMVLVYVMLFAVVSQRVRSREDIEFLLKALAMAGISMAAIGLVQRFIGNGKFLWFIEHPSRDTLTAVKGTFVNENHFVHFLALTLGPLLWWIVKEQGQAEQAASNSFSQFGTSSANASRIPRNQIVPLFGLGIVLLAALMSFSRGGLAVLALAGMTTVGMFAYQRRVGRRAILGFSVVIVVAMLAVWIHGKDLLARELETLQTASIESLDQNQGRRKIWSAVLSAVPDFAIAGSGIGSHRYVYPTYFSDKAAVQYTHAESGYLQILLEAGASGFVLLLFGISISGFWIFRSIIRGRDRVPFLAVPLASCWLVSIVHAIFDFNWFIPANMCLTLFVAATAARLSFLSLRRKSSVAPVSKRIHWAVVTCGVAVIAMFATVQFIGPAKAAQSYSEYRAWSLASNRFNAKSTGSGRQRSLGFVDPALPETTDRMLRLLEQTLINDPYQGRAHIQMAALCLRQFDAMQRQSDSGMDLAQIRDAALTSEFPTHQDMVEWVMRVVGDQAVYLERVLWHAKKGVQLTPTEGSGYLYLGEVAFLDENLKGREHELLYQAHKVRPYDPAIQFVHGRHLLLTGKQDEALLLWKDAFRRGTRVRRRIIEAIAFQAPPQEILDIFQPDLGGLRDLFEYYRRQGHQPQMAYIGGVYVAELEKQAKLVTGEPAGQLWFDAQFVHATLGHVEQAARAANHSVVAHPSNYKNHYACALRMRDAGRWEEALKQFRWCQQRRPKNQELPVVINEIKRIARQTEAKNAVKTAAAPSTEAVGRRR